MGVLRIRGTRWLWAALLLCALVLSAGGDPFGTAEPLWSRYFETNPRAREMCGTRDIPLTDRERCEAVREMFREAGMAEPVLEASGCVETCPGNVVAKLPGPAPGAIIVSAHLDRAGSGEGAVDDFSGVVMVAMLLGHFRDRTHRHTLVFVAFDGEEEGLKGSRRFIETSPHMPKDVLAVVNLECLGVTFPRSWEEGSSESLEEMFITGRQAQPDRLGARIGQGREGRFDRVPGGGLPRHHHTGHPSGRHPVARHRVGPGRGRADRDALESLRRADRIHTGAGRAHDRAGRGKRDIPVKNARPFGPCEEKC